MITKILPALPPLYRFLLAVLVFVASGRADVLDEIEKRVVRTAIQGKPGAFPSDTNMAVPPGVLNEWRTTSLTSWTSGFTAGLLWQLYNETGNSTLKDLAMQWTEGLRADQFDTSTHDIGFMVFDSFGKGVELGGVAQYTPVVLQAAESLSTRFNAAVGSIQSWNAGHHCTFDKQILTNFPVIIDNMMNLELLLWASEHESNTTRAAHYQSIALTHARSTAKNHIRADGSSFHVVDYDNETGAVVHRCAANGFHDNSSWSRGQAWCVHGFSMVYEYTREDFALQTAVRCADRFVRGLSLSQPQDSVPLWDFDWDGPKGYSDRDASAGAIAASGLLGLASSLAPTQPAKAQQYRQVAQETLNSLSSSPYLGEFEETMGVVLHATGNRMKNSSVDVSIIYTSYFLLEGLRRSMRLSAADVGAGPTLPTDTDWLLDGRQYKAELKVGDDGVLELTNGLVSRSFRTSPNFFAFDLRRSDVHFAGGGGFMRALSPEATVRVSHNCKQAMLPACSDGNGSTILCEQPLCSERQDFAIGGVDLSVLPSSSFAQFSLDALAANLTTNKSASFQFESYSSGQLSEYPPRFVWTEGSLNARKDLPWPPKGIRLNVSFTAPAACRNQKLRVHVIYELFSGIPVFSKFVEFRNGHASIESEITSLAVEQLRVPEHMLPMQNGQGARLLVETDAMPRHTYWTNYRYPSRGKTEGPGSLWGGANMDTRVFWNDDQYQDDAHDGALCVSKVFPDLLVNVSYPLGPGYLLAPNGGEFESFHVYELLQDSDDEERQELGRRAMIRTLAPQTTQSFLYHMDTGRHTDDAAFAQMMRDASSVGFDAVLSNPYNNYMPMNPANSSFVARYKALVALGKTLDPPVMLGEYTCLQQMKTINSTNNNQCVNPAGTPAPAPKAGIYRGADMATKEHREYRESVIEWIRQTGMQVLTTDCPFEGSPCAGNRPGVAETAEHRGLADSQVTQDKANQEFYRTLRARFDTVLRVPDPYFLSSGVSSSPIGYTDGYGHVTNVWQHLNIGRMYGYDGTFYKSDTQGWMGQHCPPAPMEDHLAEIDLTMAQYLGQGIASCNNCDRVFDGVDSKALLSFWLAWFKQHRLLLTTDTIHVLRPNGRDIDAVVHVDRNTSAKYRAVGHIFNPLPTTITANRTAGLSKDPNTGRRTVLRVPLYYSGLPPFTSVQLTVLESVLADDGKTVNRTRLEAGGRVSAEMAGLPASLKLNAASELLLPLEKVAIRPHSFLFFLLSPE